MFSSAGQFYENETDTSIGGKPIRIAFMSLLISGILSSAYTLVLGSPSSQLLGLLDIVIAPLAGIVSLAITAGLTHVVGMLLGFSNSYSETFSAFAYATVIAPVASLVALVPVIGAFVALALGLFSIYVQIKGIQKFQQVSLGKAALSVIVPALIIIGLLLLVVFAASAALVALMGSTAPPAPPM